MRDMQNMGYLFAPAKMRAFKEASKRKKATKQPMVILPENLDKAAMRKCPGFVKQKLQDIADIHNESEELDIIEEKNKRSERMRYESCDRSELDKYFNLRLRDFLSFIES